MVRAYFNTLYPASSRDIVEPGKHINHSPKSPSAQTQKTARIPGNYCAQKILKLRAEKVKSNLLFTLNARSNFHQQARLNAKKWKLRPFLWNLPLSLRINTLNTTKHTAEYKNPEPPHHPPRFH
jgi:hypothetical protein